ncbi:histidine kinase [Granulicoccus sp. GXG6511]|uniref:sensor histidine kinase n=1 Tax=Granulicoccus sp. GXG6511 TaxID=3381351 RepID=UPI003D7D18DA
MTEAQPLAVAVPQPADDRPPAAVQLPRAEPFLRVLAVIALVATVVGGGALLTFEATLPAERSDQLNSNVAASLLMVGMAGLATAGAVLARQQPRSVIAWLMLGTALAWVCGNLALVVALTLVDRGSPLATAAGWLTNWAWIPAQALAMVMLLRFPTGRLPGPRWRHAERLVLLWATLAVLTTALLAGPLGAEVLAPQTNPLGWQAIAPVADGLLSALFMVLPALYLMSAAAPVVRWRRAGSRERAALRWIAVAAIVLGVTAVLAVLSETGEVLQGVAGVLLPVAIGAAVLREQLWDLDLRRRYDRLSLVREQERDRLRRELHDSLGPVLGSISMRAEAARNHLARGDTARIDDLLDSIGAETESALAEVRRLIDDLGPGALHDHDLVPALQVHLAPYADSFPVTLVTRPDPLPPLEEKAAATAYLVVSEAVRNAARHSRGTRAEVTLQTRGDRLVGEVRDDGRGMGTAAPAGVGRTGMERRIAEEGGRLRVEDGVQGGTVVAFELPGALR